MLITDSEKLKFFCDKLSENEFIAIDTEFMRDKTYYPVLSLIQISSKNTTFVVDILRDLDFSPLVKLLTKNTLIKVFHSARQDCEAIMRRFNILPFPIFDTQIAAFFLGFNTQIGYDKLVNYLLSKNISKNLQFSNWLQRPLSKNQLQYALNEVTYLANLYLLMKEELNKSNPLKLNWIEEECYNCFALNNIMKSDSSTGISKYFHISKDVDYLYIIQNILKLREKKAKALNVTKNRIYSDKYIKKMLFYMLKNGSDILHSILNNQQDIKELRGMLQEHQKEEKDIIIKKLELYNKRRGFKKNDLYYKLQLLLKEVSEYFGIGSSIIATSNDILKYSNGLESNFCRGWRYSMYGKKAELVKFDMNQKEVQN